MVHRKSQGSCARKHAPGILWPGPSGWRPGRREPETSSAPSSPRVGKARLSPETNQASVRGPARETQASPASGAPAQPEPPSPLSRHHPRPRRRSGSRAYRAPEAPPPWRSRGGWRRLSAQRAPRSRRRGLPATAVALSAPRPDPPPSSPVLQIHLQDLPVALKEALHIALPGLVAQAADVHPRHPGGGLPRPPSGGGRRKESAAAAVTGGRRDGRSRSPATYASTQLENARPRGPRPPPPPLRAEGNGRERAPASRPARAGGRAFLEARRRGAGSGRVSDSCSTSSRELGVASALTPEVSARVRAERVVQPLSFSRECFCVGAVCGSAFRWEVCGSVTLSPFPFPSGL